MKGALDFDNRQQAPSREELLHSIQPGIKPTKDFYLRIYGYEITWSGFAEIALTELCRAGCSNAREEYGNVVEENDSKYYEAIKPVAKALSQQLEQKWKQKEGEGKWTQQKKQQRYQSRQQLWENLSSLLNYQ